MCLLTFIPEGVDPSLADLAMGQENNPDGFGWAIALEDRIIIDRGMVAGRVLESFAKARTQHMDAPALFHSRIATAGGLDKYNAHPFYLGNDPLTVIAHNGILPRKAQPARGDHRSDTRLLAEVYLPKHRFGAIHTHGGRKQLAKWAGGGNKFVILTANPRFKYQAYILNDTFGEWDGGCWWSNDSFREPWWHKYGGSTKWSWRDGEWSPNPYRLGEPTRKALTAREALDEEYAYEDVVDSFDVADDDTCQFCYAKGVLDNDTFLCPYCWTCQLCAQGTDNCRCPRRSEYSNAMAWKQEGYDFQLGDDDIAWTPVEQ